VHTKRGIFVVTDCFEVSAHVAISRDSIMFSYLVFLHNNLPIFLYNLFFCLFGFRV